MLNVVFLLASRFMTFKARIFVCHVPLFCGSERGVRQSELCYCANLISQSNFRKTGHHRSLHRIFLRVSYINMAVVRSC